MNTNISVTEYSPTKTGEYPMLYVNQINARALIGESAMVYCASNLYKSNRRLEEFRKSRAAGE